VRLFCFPFAGGGASAYRLWQQHLPAGIEVWPVEYPGHETRFREPAFDNAGDLAAAIAEQVAGADSLPFAFFGHSMGALIAFETFRHLRRSGGPQPLKLFVSGFAAPHLKPVRPPISGLPEAQFRDELRRYGGTPEQVLADEAFMRFLSPLLRRDLGMCETHVHADEARLRVPVVAFGGYDDPVVPWWRLLPWCEQSDAGFSAHFMPGQHFFMKDAAPRICERIAAYLDDGMAGLPLPPPGRREVHLWTVRIALDGTEAVKLRPILSGAEQQAADAFVQTADRARYTTTRAALRHLLGRYGNRDPRNIAFGLSGTGKPWCEALWPLDFNVSHSGTMAVIAITSGCPVGVDVEHIRQGLDTAGIGRQVFTETEIAQLAGVPAEQRGEAFFDLWVRKEARLKCSGDGLAGAPRETHVGLGSRFHAIPDMFRTAANVQSFGLAPDYAAAVATEEAIDQMTVREWRLEPPE
jgi:medium-chain acyl-[acyl-carrier-protein] hydrolase